MDRGGPASADRSCPGGDPCEPEADWSVAGLARLAGMSRSAFAEAFLTTAGDTPTRYLTELGMHLARQWLAGDGAKGRRCRRGCVMTPRRRSAGVHAGHRLAPGVIPGAATTRSSDAPALGPSRWVSILALTDHARRIAETPAR